jgi:hypothetical protein
MLNKTEKENNKDINCFTKLKTINMNKDFIHNKIFLYRKNMKSEYEHDNNFKEIMPIILKQSKMNNVYKALIKNGIKFNSRFIRLIQRTVDDIKNKRILKSYKEKNKGKIFYNLPKIEILKTQKEKYKKLNIKKIRIIKLKNLGHINNINNLSFNFINESAKIDKRPKLIFRHFSSISNKSTKNLSNLNFISNSPNKDLTLTPSNISIAEPSTNITYEFSNKIKKSNHKNSFFKLTNISKSYDIIHKCNSEVDQGDYKTKNINKIKKSNHKNSFFKLTNISKSYDIIHKCNSEVDQGDYKTKNINRIKKDFDKSIYQRLIRDKYLDLDRKIIEEKNKFNNKYIIQQKKNFKNIKKKLEVKISSHLAYENRKELTQILKEKKSDIPYNLHLNEINKINQRILERRKKEKKIIYELNSIANDEYLKGIEINKKMDKINQKNKILKNNSFGNINIFNDDMDFFQPKGNLIPSLLNIRKNKMKNIRIYKRCLDYI